MFGVYELYVMTAIRCDCIFIMQGQAVEREKCGGPHADAWDCMYGGGSGSYFSPDFPPHKARIEVKAEIGTNCRCGCVVHLNEGKPRRLIASSAESCPGRSLWLIQADDGHQIRAHFDFFRLMCPSQYVKIRDGDSLGSELIAEIYGGVAGKHNPVMSSDVKLLLEFYSDDFSTIGETCKGGFLIHSQQIREYSTGAAAFFNVICSYKPN